MKGDTMANKNKIFERSIEWEDKKRTLFGLPLSFTKYTLTHDILYVSNGVLTKREEELRLYKVTDISLARSLSQRMMGLGSILVESSDKSTPMLILENVKNSQAIKDRLSQLVEENKRGAGVVSISNI